MKRNTNMFRALKHIRDIVLILLMITGISFAADSTNSAASRSDKFINDVSIFVEDGFSFYSKPFHFSANEWLYTGGVLGSTYFLMRADEDLNNRIARKNAQTKNGDGWDIFFYYGTVEWVTLAAGATYTTGLFTDNDEIRKVGRMWLQALSYSGLLVESIRIMAGRHRPYSNDGPWEFRGPTLDNLYQSFASGHTTVAFATSTVLAEFFGTAWSRIGFYGLAGVTGFVRAYNNQHWASDVFLGAVIGFVGGWHVVNEENKRMKKSGDAGGLTISPTIGGINIIYRF